MNCTDFTKKDVKKKLNEALECIEDRDSYLLINDLNERTISHRLAMYLERFFNGWDVDCEYNKDHDITKILHIRPEEPSVDDTDAKTVYPDIIIHKRGTNDNLLVMEVKKTTNNDTGDYDKEKLKAFKKEKGYCFAVAQKLRTACDDYGVEKPEFI